MIKLHHILPFLMVSAYCHAQSTYNVVVKPKITYQTIADFGASDCWTADFVGKYFDDKNKENAAKWLFSQQYDANGNPEGIGLSMWRVNIGAGSAEQGDASGIDDITRRCYCYLGSDGKYTWTKSSGQQYFMKKAKEYGVDNFLLFSNSAPVQFTKNGKAFADGGLKGCNLKDDCYDDFAEFLTTTTKHFVDDGYNVKYIDPVNEPQYDWTSGQEGSPWENANIATLAKELDKSITSKGLSTKILMPEAGSWEYLSGTSGRASKQLDAFFNSNNTSTYIGNLSSLAPVMAGHSYWTFDTNDHLSTFRQSVADEATKYGVSLMQTEWSMLDAAPKAETGFPNSYDNASYMDIALFMGKLIYCDLVYTNVTSWSYWTSMAQEKWGQKNRFYLLRLNATGDNDNESYGDISKGGIVNQNSNLWVLGNYSFFIRPGFKRIALEGADNMTGLMGSAYLSPDEKRIVVVYVNMGAAATGMKLDLGDLNDDVKEISEYVTDASNNLKKTATSISSFPTSRIVIPKRSVVTFVIDLNTTGIDDVTLNSNNINNTNDVYSIDGVRVKKNDASLDGLSSGVYICNGKKYVVK